MFSDYHVHSNFSFDSKEEPNNIIEQAIKLNMKQIVFTDHQDIEWPISGESPYLDLPKYTNTLNQLKEKYKNDIQVITGVELGLMPSTASQCEDFIKSNHFDFVIGSCHIVDGLDPYYSYFWENRPDRQAFELYFNTLLDSIESFHNINALGHMDYVVRYSPNQYSNYSPFDYIDIIDKIIKILISNDIMIEINTSNYAKGFEYTNPHIDIIKRYKELGGRYVSVGSDAHKAEYIGFGFDKAKDIVDSLGLKIYTI